MRRVQQLLRLQICCCFDETQQRRLACGIRTNEQHLVSFTNQQSRLLLLLLFLSRCCCCSADQAALRQQLCDTHANAHPPPTMRLLLLLPSRCTYTRRDAQSGR